MHHRYHQDSSDEGEEIKAKDRLQVSNSINHVQANIEMAPIQNQVISINNMCRNIAKDENRDYIKNFL